MYIHIPGIRVFVQDVDVSSICHLFIVTLPSSTFTPAIPLSLDKNILLCSTGNKKTSGIPATTCITLSDAVRNAFFYSWKRSSVLIQFFPISFSRRPNQHHVQYLGLNYVIQGFPFLVIYSPTIEHNLRKCLQTSMRLIGYISYVCFEGRSISPSS